MLVFTFDARVRLRRMYVSFLGRLKQSDGLEISMEDRTFCHPTSATREPRANHSSPMSSFHTSGCALM
jgi:hypothetical protein